MTGAVREYTRYFDFEVPEFDFPGWHTYYDRNLTMIDQILYLMTGITTIRGAWKNSTQYIVEDRVLDVDTNSAYACLVTHVSSPVPTTFNEDRIAFPDRWQLVSIIQSLVGTSLTPNTINTGAHVFDTQKGRLFNPGVKILVTADVAPTTNQMWGEVISYDVDTVANAIVTIDVQAIEGGGSFSAWHLSVSGERGPQGVPGAPGAAGGVPEAPTTPVGVIFGRRSDATWQPVSEVTGSGITFPAGGDISSTNVQAAIQELDIEKYPKAGGLLSGDITIVKDFAALNFKSSPTEAGIAWREADNDPRFGLTANASTLTMTSYSGALVPRTSFYIQDSDGFLKVPNAPASGLDVVNRTYADGITTALTHPTTGRVSKQGDTMFGDLVISKDTPYLRLNKTTATAPILLGSSNNFLRWGVDLASTAGDHFYVHRYAANGSYIEAAMGINWNDGSANFARGLMFHSAVDGGFRAYSDASNNILQMAGTGTVMFTSRTAGSVGNLWIRRNGVDAIYLDGNVNLYGGKTIVQSPHLQVNSSYLVQGCVSCYMQSVGGIGMWNANGILGLGQVNSNGDPSTLILQITNPGDGIQLHSTNAYKTTAGGWIAPSDARIKTVTSDYTSGLDAINTLQPVRYTYKGNNTKDEPIGSVPYTNSPHHSLAASGQECIGLIAQDVETLFPEMVTQTNSKIDGVDVTDLRIIDTSPLVFALINAVKELSTLVATQSARIEQLENRNADTRDR